MLIIILFSLQLPTMIDKMVAVGLASGKSATSIEALHLLLKRPWDPVLSTYNQQKPVSY